LYLIVFGVSLLSSLALTRYVRNLALGLGWVAPPLQERDLHKTPLPRYGGVAIFLSFLISIGVGLLAGRHLPAVAALPIRTLMAILLPGALIFLLGLCDDIRSIGPYFKFAVQGLAATMLFAGGLRILDLPFFFGSRQFGWHLGLPLTILWVIGITNAFNLIDGLDGLAAGSAVFSTLVVFVVALFSGSSLVSLLTIALAGATLGFLRFNFNPATIFLGDCGSLFIGFMLSALALQGVQKSPTVVAVAIPVVSFGLPILDTILSVLRRFIGGRPVFTADRDHIHHKLLQRGLSQRKVVILLYAVSGLFALLSLFLLWPTGSTLGLVLAVLGTGVWLGVQRLGYLEFGEIRRVAKRTIEQRNIFVNNLFIRRAIEELKVAKDYAELCQILETAFSENDFDGFILKVNSPEDHNGTRHLPLLSTLAQFKWSKTKSRKLPDNCPAWKLTLQLVTSGGRNFGSMEVYRVYNERPLLLDINLLTSDFPTVLADALDRVLTTLEVVPEAETYTQFRAAEAG
jgi:UDP-GlcNAc:undecaprenyl-phosphate GlcNAc-1-phosphate transferase